MEQDDILLEEQNDDPTPEPEPVPDDVEHRILALAQTYFGFTGETVSDAFLLLLIQRVIEDYKLQRHYPDGLSAEDIQSDVDNYFTVRQGYVATEVIPAMLGKVGGEGLYSLVDNQVSKNWKYPFPVYLPDVIPYCEVV